ncbi:MAG: N-acetylmuramoyl-L-alanine amidase [Alphaproteobacteria bacterium]|nr:MAG: N-acetylmuramoyl-L-alanine amidase [Alphaproteobacteria bacterium]
MAVEEILFRPSPNFDARGGSPIDMLVLHYTGMKSGAAALDRLTDPAAKVSSHYLIEEDGRIFKLVEEEYRAWHAGVAFWRGHRDINARSVGIEIVNPGHEFGYRAFSKAQMQSVLSLAKDIVACHKIEPRNVVGHSDVAPARKEDPGELFDWARLAAEGVGLWIEADVEDADALRLGDEGEGVNRLQRALGRIGYDAVPTGQFDEGLAAIVRAFQRHWRQSRVDGILDAETQSLIYALDAVIAA